MNDIPLLNLVPPKYQHWVVAATLIAPYLGRLYHALVNGGGLSGAWKAIMFGTNTPKPTPPADTTPKPTTP